MLCQGSKQHAMVRSTSGAVVALELNQWSNAPPKIAPLRLFMIIESFVMVLLLLLLMLLMLMMIIYDDDDDDDGDGDNNDMATLVMQLRLCF